MESYIIFIAILRVLYMKIIICSMKIVILLNYFHKFLSLRGLILLFTILTSLKRD